MQTGYVYLLTNPAMPGLLKIGMTTRDPKDRVGELSGATGVPVPFKLERSWRVTHVYAAETDAHKVLAKHRLSGKREFFVVELEVAVKMLSCTLARYRESDLRNHERRSIRFTAVRTLSAIIRVLPSRRRRIDTTERIVRISLLATQESAKIGSKLGKRYWTLLPDELSMTAKTLFTAAIALGIVVLTILLRDYSK